MRFAALTLAAVALCLAGASGAEAQRGTRERPASLNPSPSPDEPAKAEAAKPEAAAEAPKAAENKATEGKAAESKAEAPAAEAPPAAPAGPPPPAVTVVTLKEQNVTLTALLPGRVVASGVAEVRPQVDGIIVERLFEEGAEVTLGDPMYRIDPASYAAAVAAAEAAVAQAQANYNAADKDATRQQQLRQRGVASEQNLESAIATRDAADAALKVAEAQLLAAQIDLERTTIRAQLSGVAGLSLTTQGALVTAGQSSPLAVIRTLDPINVDVTQSAAELLEFRRGLLQQRLRSADTSVSLTLADGTEYDQKGELTAAEPYVNEQTGVVKLRLSFANPDDFLLPGMYVQVQMPQGVAENVVLAPQEGVTRDRRGRPIAFVVGEGDVVQERALSIAGSRGSDWIVTEGLGDGDRMVVAGLQGIGNGAKVRPQERAPSEAEAAPPATAPEPTSAEATDSRPARAGAGGPAHPTPKPDTGARAGTSEQASAH